MVIKKVPLQRNPAKGGKKILIIAAHPDDETLGCGGTIAKLKKEGSQISCLFLGQGKSSRHLRGKDKKSKIEKEQVALKEEASKAAKILGISKVFFENFPDQQYETIPLIKIIKSIEKVKGQIKPDTIFTHHSGDLNLDHQITLKAVLTACRPVRGETVKKIYSFEVLSSTEWGIPKRKDCFVPNYFVDISKTLSQKIKALDCYKSELKKYPHPRSLKAIKIIAQRWGTVVGKNFVEAFELIRCIK
ncbi:PIG-L family deacetylase [Patescibacteria group bacterium]|nr:PIG-L family deacetylase [Patescibacteria group bacterium]